jgi:hypothetical protein
MIDPTATSTPPWHFKGQGWIFLLSPISSNSSQSLQRFVDHNGTNGQFTGGPGSLSLYHYTDSPFGPYDELSYSPGSYEYLKLRNSRSNANRIRKSYVSCSQNDVRMIRSQYGIPAEQVQFRWQFPTEGQCIVQITLPTGEHIIEMLFQQTAMPEVTINSMSILSPALDFAKLMPIVQPLLDGNQVPIPRGLEPYSPLLQSAPLLKSYTSIQASSGVATLVRAITNAQLFPPIEQSGVSRYGLILTDMEMTLSTPEIVLDVPRPRERRNHRTCCAVISNWINPLIFRELR